MALENRLHAITVALPGKVISRDLADNTVDVEVQTRIPIDMEDDTVGHETLPVIPAVPVLFAKAGAYSITFPISPGDTGTVLVMTYSISKWLDSGKVSEPGDTRVSHISNAVFLPGLCPKAQIPASVSTVALVLDAPTEIHLGAGATQFVALANLVKAELEKIEAALSTASAPPGGGAVVYGVPYAAGDVAATKVKGE